MDFMDSMIGEYPETLYINSISNHAHHVIQLLECGLVLV